MTIPGVPLQGFQNLEGVRNLTVLDAADGYFLFFQRSPMDFRLSGALEAARMFSS